MRYLKLYATYAKLSLMSKLVYKANVIIGVIAFLFAEATSLFTLYVLVSSVPSIDGYSIYHIGLLFGLTNMAVGIDHLLTDRLWMVAYFEVKLGRLDHMFLRPLPVLFQVIASEVQLEALGELIVATALIILCASNLSFTGGALAVLLVILGIICAAVIISSFKIMVASLAFKFKRSGPLLQFIYNFSGYTKYPMKIYPKAIQIILTFVIPLGLCLFYPFENLFTPVESPALIALGMVGFTIIFSALCIFIWTKMVKMYESTGT
ncbi:MAG: ABC-2 family transporter protein [Clostridia bacterium]|nr:ABC-2 family transporter protein [Clostridia bacterium]